MRTTAPVGEAVFHSVSAPPFKNPYTWGELISDAAIAQVVRPASVQPMSAMLAFDTWLECHDHLNHPGNLLGTVIDGKTFRYGLAYIDYALSIVFQWKRDGYKSSFVAPIYDPTVSVDDLIVREAVSAIQQVSDATINEILFRIPSAFLAAPDRQLISDGLRHRRDNLQRTVIATYPGVEI